MAYGRTKRQHDWPGCATQCQQPTCGWEQIPQTRNCRQDRTLKAPTKFTRQCPRGRSGRRAWAMQHPKSDDEVEKPTGQQRVLYYRQATGSCHQHQLQPSHPPSAPSDAQTPVGGAVMDQALRSARPTREPTRTLKAIKLCQTGSVEGHNAGKHAREDTRSLRTSSENHLCYSRKCLYKVNCQAMAMASHDRQAYKTAQHPRRPQGQEGMGHLAGPSPPPVPAKLPYVTTQKDRRLPTQRPSPQVHTLSQRQRWQ